jgi:hypothetical protein
MAEHEHYVVVVLGFANLWTDDVENSIVFFKGPSALIHPLEPYSATITYEDDKNIDLAATIGDWCATKVRWKGDKCEPTSPFAQRLVNDDIADEVVELCTQMERVAKIPDGTSAAHVRTISYDYKA